MNSRLQILSFYLMLILNTYLSIGQDLYWHQNQAPRFSDFRYLSSYQGDSIIIAGKELLIGADSHWQVFHPQPPCQIHKISVISTGQIYVSNLTPYQNSDLFFWNGKQWEHIHHPVANNINEMYFDDVNNGILVSYGEIAVLQNGYWRHLTPPTNHDLSHVCRFNGQIYVLSPGTGIYVSEQSNWQLIPNTQKVKFFKKTNSELYVVGYDYLGKLIHNKLQIIHKNDIWLHVNDILPQTDKIICIGNNGLVFNLINNKIIKIDSNSKQNLNQIKEIHHQIWIVGNEGIILNLQQRKPKAAQKIWKGFKQHAFYQKAKITDDQYGVVTADFNKDGLTDIFVAGLFEEDKLYINQGNMQFVNQAKAFGIADNSSKNELLDLGACAGDLDNDGDMDLYISVLNGKNIIYKNINGKYFVDYSRIAGGTGQANDRTNACIIGDVDNDGDLDIFIANEFKSNRLYLNNGVGIFKEITLQSGLQSKEGGNGASFADIDQDGDLDLLVTNWSQQNILYKNLLKETRQLQFEDITQTAGVGGNDFDKSNAVIFADLNKDTYPDLFICNRKTTNRLYINNKNGTFTDKTRQLIGLDTMASYGAVIADFDGDSYKDLYVSNVGNNVFYKNINGHFVKQTQTYGAHLGGYSTGSALADFDNNNTPDFYAANYFGAGSRIYQNKADSKQFYTISIRSFLGNRNGVGAKIFLYNKENQLQNYYEITTGNGYVSMSQPKIFLAVKGFPSYLKAVLPTGQIIKKTITATSPHQIILTDVSPFQQKWYGWLQQIKIGLFDPHHLWGNLQLLLVLLVLWYSSRRAIKKMGWSKKFAWFTAILLILLYTINYRYFEYYNFILSSLLPIVGILLIIFLLHYYFERQIIKIEAVRKQKELKQKISRNLHDDFAATLSSIGLYNAMLQSKLSGENTLAKELSDKAGSLINEATETITDLIWGIQNKPENLENIFMRIQNNLKPLLQAKKINFSLNWQKESLKKIKLQDTLKQNTFLIIKEAVNNALKYAGAQKINIDVSQKNRRIYIHIKDNGKGFDIEKQAFTGHGLQNMKNRAEELPQGDFEIISGTTGTEINFSFVIK